MQPNQPLVSIIIPTYNRAHLIGETLDSVLAQTYFNWECIVVDDGSSDNTDEVVGAYVAKDSRFKYYHRPPEHLPGGNGARNFGFKMSRGEYVNWLDSDDLMHPEKILLQIESIFDSACNISICQTVRFENNIQQTLGFSHPNICSKDPLNDFIANRIKWFTPSALISKKLLINHNLIFDERLLKHQEWDFFTKLLMFENKYCAIETGLVFYRKHNNSISVEKTKLERQLALFYSRYNLLMNRRSNLISYKNINLMKMQLIGVIQVFLMNKNYKLANHHRILLFKIKYLNFSEKFKINLAFLSYFVFGRGERLLKF